MCLWNCWNCQNFKNKSFKIAKIAKIANLHFCLLAQKSTTRGSSTNLTFYRLCARIDPNSCWTTEKNMFCSTPHDLMKWHLHNSSQGFYASQKHFEHFGKSNTHSVGFARFHSRYYLRNFLWNWFASKISIWFLQRKILYLHSLYFEKLSKFQK